MTKPTRILSTTLLALAFSACAAPGDDCAGDVQCDQDVGELAAMGWLAVAVSGSPQGPGSVSAFSDSIGAECSGGTCSIDAGGYVRLTATPEPGARFVRWIGCGGGTNPSTTVQFVLADTSCTATFERAEPPQQPPPQQPPPQQPPPPPQQESDYRVYLRGTVDGRERSDIRPFLLSSNGTKWFEPVVLVSPGSSIQLEAPNYPNIYFSHWEGCGNNGSYRLIEIPNIHSGSTCTVVYYSDLQ